MTVKPESGFQKWRRRDMARAFGVSISTVIRMEKNNPDFPKPKTWGNCLMYDAAEVMAWMEKLPTKGAGEVEAA